MTAALARSHKLRLAIGSGFAARGAGALVQIASIPFAAGALGNESFVVYGVAAAILGWLQLSQFGIGPALTVQISGRLGCDDQIGMKKLFATGIALTFVIGLFTTVIAIGILFGYPDAIYHRAWSMALNRELFECALIVIALFNISNFLTLIESAQAGFQERHRLNIFTVGGSVVAAISIFFVAILIPRPSLILLAAQAPVLAARALNSVFFLRSKSLPLATKLDLPIAIRLLKQGIAFMGAGSLSNFLLHAFPILLVGTRVTATGAAQVLAVMNFVIILASFFALSAVPLMAAVPEAKARDDRQWIRLNWYRIAALNVLFGSSTAVALIWLGVPLFDLWYRGTIHPPQLSLVLAGVYLAFLGLEVANHALLCGLGRTAETSSFLVARGVTVALALVLWPSLYDPTRLFALLAASAFFVTGLPLTIKAEKLTR